MAVTTAESSVEGPSAASTAVPLKRASDFAWVWQVTALSMVLGAMAALAVRTTAESRTSTVPDARIQVSAAFEARYRDENAYLQQKVMDLRHQVSQYVADMKGQSSQTESLKQEFEQLKLLAGHSPVEGPGLKITLQDSTEIPNHPGQPDDYTRYMVHDQDLNALLTELKEAGAQHLAISGADESNVERMVVTTTTRCVGPVAVVNGNYLSAPYHLLALGDPQQLRAFLERPDGYIRGLRQLDALKMVQIEEVPRLALPEHVGIPPRYARPVASAAASEGNAPESGRKR